jgi:hypothetical protein
MLRGLVGRPIGDRIGALLTFAGLYTVAAAGVGLATRQP